MKSLENLSIIIPSYYFDNPGLVIDSLIPLDPLEILVVEREDLDSIPLGSPMIYNAG